MNIGFSLSNKQGIEDVQGIVRLAVRAEALGLDVEKLQAFDQLGVETVVISPYSSDPQEMVRGLEVVAEEVLPALRGA